MSKQQGNFKKSLNLLDLTLLGVGSIIGSGWLFASQTGATMAGSNAWIAWVIGAIAVLLIGLVYAELGAAIPRAGGFVRYPDYSHGSLVGFLIGFASMLAYSSVAGIEVEAVRGYAQYWWPALGTSSGGPTTLGFVIEILLLILFFLLNYWSVNIFGKINTVITSFKFIVPLVTIVILLAHLKTSNFSVVGANPGGAKGIMQAVSTGGIVFAFLGFRQAVDFAGEAKNPQRDVPRAIIFAVIVCTAVYVLLQLSFIGSVPMKDLANGWAGVNFKSPFAGLATALGFTWLTSLIFFDAVVSPTGTGNIYLSGTSRVLFAWAKNGYFYKAFQKVDPKTGVPRGALWLSLILAILWVLPSQFQMWGGLVSAVTSATVMTYMVGPVSAAAFRKKAADLPRPFRLKGLPILAPLAFIAATLIIYWSGWSVDLFLIGLTLASLVLYFAFLNNSDKLKTDWKSGIWLIVYYLFILFMSRFGSFGPANIKKPLIPAPWDSILVAVLGLVFYYWGVNSALNKAQIKDEDEEDAKQVIV